MKQKAIGLFFGSFNPIHTGHLIIASHILENAGLDEIWFVVSPQNPFKPKGSLLNEQHRLDLIRRSIDCEPRFKASNIEFHLPKPSYTVDTLIHLKSNHPDLKFRVIMGSDSFQNIDNWKNGEQIKSNYNIIVYRRPGFEVAEDLPANITLLTAPLLQISATHIRENIRLKKSIKWLVPKEAEEEIIREQYYSSGLENNT